MAERPDPSREDIERAREFLRGLRRPTINRNVPEGIALQAMFGWHQQESEREREAADLARMAHAEIAREVGVRKSGDRGDGGTVLGSGLAGTAGDDRA